MFLKSMVFWAYVATFLGVFGHATSEFFSKLSGVGGPELSVWRYLVGALALLIVALGSKKSRNLIEPIKEKPLLVIPLSVVGMAFSQLIFHWSLDFASIVQVATIVTMMPIGVMLVDRLLNKATITTPKVVSGIGAFVGVVLLITDGYIAQLKLGSSGIYGVLLAMTCACTASFYLVLVRPVISEYGAIRITALTFILGGIALWITVGVAWGIWVNPMTLFDRPPQGYWSILTLGIWNTCIAMILWLWGLASVPDMSRANYLFFLKPVIAAVLAYFIMDTRITAFQVLAILMVCGCVLVEVFYDQISSKISFLKVKESGI